MIILYILLHLIAGLGILAHFEAVRKRAELAGLAVLTGMGVHTVMVYFMELLHINLTSGSVLGGMIVISLFCHIGYKKSLALFQHILKSPFDAKIYEIPFILMGLYLVYISSWRAYYLPVTPYDAIVGMDMVAKYAAKEGHIISSAFTHPNLSGHIQNQMFYAPFTTFSQLLYRLAGHTIGQTWLGVVCGAFFLWFYGKTRSITHPVIAGICTFLLIAIPEMYAYSFMFLTDYSTAVFFGAGVVYFYTATQDGTLKTLILSALMFGFSVWSRSDSIVFIPFGALVIFIISRKIGMKEALFRAGAFSAIPAVFFTLWNILFFQLLPRVPQNQIGENAGNIGSLLVAYSDIINKLVLNEIYYGYAFMILFLWFILSLIVTRSLKGWEVSVWVLILFIGFGLIVNIFTAASIDNTIKRGFFKFFPVIYFYIAISPLSQQISGWMYRLEGLKSST